MPTTGSPVRASTAESATGRPSACVATQVDTLVGDMTTTDRASLLTHLRNTSRILVKEIAAFGLDRHHCAWSSTSAIFKALSPDGALKAKCISTLVSTLFAYLGNRYLSFSHRARTSLGRETAFFFGINLITLAFSEAILALTVYGFHQPHGGIVVFIVNFGTIGAGHDLPVLGLQAFRLPAPRQDPHPGRRPRRRAGRIKHSDGATTRFSRAPAAPLLRAWITGGSPNAVADSAFRFRQV